MALPTIFACLKAHPCLASFPAHRNWIEALHTWAWAFLSMASVEMLEGFFARPHLEVPLPTFLDFRTKIGVKGLCCRIMISSLNKWNATNAKHSNVACCWGNLFCLGLPAKHCHLSDSSTSLTCSAWHGSLESDELDFRRRDGSLPTAPAMTQHLGKSLANDLQLPCNAMPSQCINACQILGAQRGPTMTLPSWKDIV